MHAHVHRVDGTTEGPFDVKVVAVHGIQPAVDLDLSALPALDPGDDVVVSDLTEMLAVGFILEGKRRELKRAHTLWPGCTLTLPEIKGPRPRPARTIDPKEWKAMLAAPAGEEPIPGGHGAVQCRRCRAVLMPGTEEYDWHGASLAHACDPVAAVPREAIPALLSEREEMLAVLREVEWGGMRQPEHGEPSACCLLCRGLERQQTTSRGLVLPRGHAPGCRLAALLA